MKTVLILLALVFALPASLLAQDGLRARVTDKSRKKYEVELLGRGGTAWVRMETVDTDPRQELRMAPGDISKIEFIVDLASTKVDDRYQNNEFKEVAAILHQLFRNHMDYIDLPNNIMPFMQMYVRSLFWSDQFAVLENIGKKIVAKVPAGDPAVLEAQSFIAYCMLQRGDKEGALKLINSLDKAGHQDETDAAYWFARGAINLEAGNLDAGQESIARVIGFQTKDFKWMPAGLYMSAKGYVEAHNYESAEKVMRNIGIAYPQSNWKHKVIDLLTYAKQHQKDFEEAERKRLEAEAKQAEIEALPFRKQVQKEIAKLKVKGELPE